MKTAERHAVSSVRRLWSDRNPVKRRRNRPRLEWVEDRTLLSTFLVSNTGDSGPGSLRQAILDSNAATAATNTIDFDISGSGVQTIFPLSSLPAITNPVLIDGDSQPGYAGTPLIELNGSQAGGGDGLAITATDVTVRGLDINNFSQGAGIDITGTGATGNWIDGNIVGMDPTGTQAEPNEYGVLIGGGAADNRIGSNVEGGNSTGQANLISGNTLAGVDVGSAPVGFAPGSAGVPQLLLTLNGTASIHSGQLELTDGGNYEAGSAFLSQPEEVSQFSTQFQFQLTNAQADGITFTIQGQGPTALGAVGGDLGYGGIGQSVAVKFDLYNNAGEGNDSTGLFTDGAHPFVPAIDLSNTGIDLHSGDVFQVDMSYGGTNLSVTITDIKTGATAAQSYQVNIPGTVGGSMAYVGFTGGTGGLTAVQDILSWNFNAAGNASGNQVVGNVITQNSGPGVVVVGANSVGNAITANRIFGNTGQAIDLGDDGVTANGTPPRQGPNNLQNFPIIVTTAGGQVEGYLGGSEPDTIYRIDVFASAGYGPGGAGEAEDYLGSLQVTTDDSGQVTFDVPFTAPAGLPIITATATDPLGNTSEVSALRSAALQAPTQSLIDAPDQPLVFSSGAGDAIAVQDPDAGPLDLVWDITLSVTSGVLTLATTAGITGSGDGTGSLSYQGPLSAIDAALAGLTYTPAPEYQGSPVLSLSANSVGAAPLQSQVTFLVTSGQFAVTTTADSGPGSLRQAILDSNIVNTGAPSTIDFDIPGFGVQTIEPLSSLPAITNPVLIDAETQPGYAGMPLIELNGSQTGSAYWDGLTITCADVTVCGVTIDNFSQGAGIHISGPDATNDWVYGDFLGTDPTGTQAEPNAFGVEIDGGATQNIIGTNGDGIGDDAERNLISGNSYDGIWINGQGTGANVVAGNLIGTSVTGDTALPNGKIYTYIYPYGAFDAGVLISGASGNWIGINPGGADVQAEGNVISGNSMGVSILGSNGNVVAGNEIGTDATGSIAVPNQEGGIEIVSEPTGNSLGGPTALDNTLGGTTASAGNLIAYNGGPGVQVTSTDDESVGNQITANRIFSNTGQAIALGNDSVAGNGTAPRQGPNNLQNYPMIFAGAGGQVEGWLYGSTPDTTYRIDVFASSAYSADGSGEAQNFLGSMEVTTDATGNVVFTIPFTAPSGSPIITATATDPQGNTSEISAIRQAVGHASESVFHLTAGQPSSLSVSSGHSVAILDPSAVTIDPVWSFSLSVEFGTLTLTTLDGLVGSGDGTGSLSYQGSLSAVDAALNGLVYIPQPGASIDTDLRLSATSAGATPIELQVVLTNDLFFVTTTADSGAGSLRQAIIDSNAATGAPNTIDFAIPGGGAQTISPITPLPPITNPVLIDGTSEPGFSGTPLIEISGLLLGGAGPLSIDSSVDVRAVSMDGFAMDGGSLPSIFTDQSLPLPGMAGGSAGAIESYSFQANANEELTLVVDAGSVPTKLLLLDSSGNVLIQSDGQSQAGGEDIIKLYVPVGSYTIELQNLGGAGTYDLTATASPANNPFPPIVLNGNASLNSVVTGDFAGNGTISLATIGWNAVAVVLGNGDGTFAPPVTYATGPELVALAAGDFTGDGRLDLAVVDAFSSTLSILLNNGDGAFTPAGDYSAGPGPAALVAGDFTGDGNVDLAVVDNASGTVAIFLGHGDGTFSPPVSYAVGSGPDAIVAGDFTGDGHLDLAVVNGNGNTVSVLLGNGDGTFAPAVNYAVGSGPDAIVAGDFTGDGHLDLAVTNGNDGTVSVLLGHGDGTFAPAVPYKVGADPSAIVAGEFTSDSHIDLAVANYNDNTVSILLGNGNGTFAPPVDYEVARDPNGIAAGDFTGDGHLDLAVADYAVGGISVLLGQGDGTFVPMTEPPGNPVGPFPNSIVAADFRGDGRLDLATANSVGDTISVLLGNGDGTFAPAMSYAVGAGPDAIVAGDFNGDGRLDLAVANSGNDTVSVLLGNGDGTFAPAVSYAVGSDPDAIVAGDFTGDGILDLAVANSGDNTVSVLLGHGNGTFLSQVTYPVGVGPDAMVAASVTGDGHLDLAVANRGVYGSSDHATVSVLLGRGDGTFATQIVSEVSNWSVTSPIGMTAGDFNGDGRVDLALTLRDGFVAVALNNGDGTFTPGATYQLGSATVGITAGDFTGDGHLDLAVASLDFGISVLPGNGDGTFGGQEFYSTGPGDVAIVGGDFNGDGRQDLAVVSEIASSVSVLLNTGEGTFGDPSQIASTAHATPLVADASGDGTADVMVVDGSGNILYRQGIPGEPGSFEPPVTINPGVPSRDIAWLPNTDQGPVLASVDATDNAISFYAYRDGGFVQLSGSLATSQLPAQIVAADLNGDGLTDLVVRNAGDGTLSVYFGSQRINSKIVGPLGSFDPPTFLSPVTLSVGLGVSDVQVVDTTGTGALDLVVTNKLTGEVSIVRNLGDGSFAPPEPYFAGTGLYALDSSGSSPVVTSLEATAGVAAGAFTTGGPTDLVTINPGTKTVGVLAGLGDGRFANPVALYTGSPPLVVRVADFNHDGIPDLAVLSAKGVSIYLDNGKGGFSSPVTYNAGTDPTGLTVTDLLGNGQLDLLVGNAYGDVLILVGNGDGTFRPFEPVKAAIALAVADLTGNGTLDFVFADQSLNQVSVVYGSTSQNSTGPQVIGNQTTGVLAPGAVKLADMNGDGIPDLIVANSGGNNVLVYPGLGNGQFGPPIGGTKGFAVGTDPTGLTVANLNGQPDLLVADTGSNDVSVLLGQGSGSSWTMIPGARVQTDAGPVATVVGNLLGGTQTDLAVANSGADNVQVFPSVGSGFFNDQSAATNTYAVGQDPSALFLGNFGLGLGLATLNAGSNNGTLISNAGSANPVIKSFATGGDSPTSGFAGDFNSNGLTDLVVGNNGDGHLALLLGGSGGLSLSQSLSNSAAPNPTAVSFGGVSDGVLSFYVSTAGHDAALEMAFDLSSSAAIIGPGTAPLLGVSSVPGAMIFEVARLGDVTGSPFDLIATLVTLTILPENLESELESGGGGAALLASFSPGGSTGLGQSIGVGRSNDGSGGGEPEVTNPANAAGPGGTGQASTPVDRLAPWAQFAVGLDEAWQELRARLVPSAAENGIATGSGSPRIQSQAPPSLAPQADPSRSETKSRSGSRDGTKSPLPAKRQEPANAATNGVWRSEPGSGVSVSLSSRAGFPPVLAAVDAALEELGESLPRSNKLLRIVPPATDERTDSAVQDMMEIAAASMAMSMTWERAVVAGRGRREARRVPRRVEVT